MQGCSRECWGEGLYGLGPDDETANITRAGSRQEPPSPGRGEAGPGVESGSSATVPKPLKERPNTLSQRQQYRHRRIGEPQLIHYAACRCRHRESARARTPRTKYPVTEGDGSCSGKPMALDGLRWERSRSDRTVLLYTNGGRNLIGGQVSGYVGYCLPESPTFRIKGLFLTRYLCS